MTVAFFHCWSAADIAGWELRSAADDDDAATQAVLHSPPFEPAAPIREAIPSWAATTPPGSWIELQLRARIADRWTKYFRVACWDAAEQASRRRSFPPQADADAEMATDTLRLHHAADALQLRILLCGPPNAALPRLRSLALCASQPAAEPRPPRSLPIVEPIVTPLYSQYSYPDGAGWCSPVALAMLLGYWQEQSNAARLAALAGPAGVPALAALVYDPLWRGTGNWAFNTAAAAALGMEAWVSRLHNLEQLARWLAAAVPLICSIAWDAGELDDAPLEQSHGHLLLVTGCGGGRVHVADPAGAPGSVARSYRAFQFESCWQRASNGTVYLIYPPGWPTPLAGPHDAW